jgi:hypothetical protein
MPQQKVIVRLNESVRLSEGDSSLLRSLPNVCAHSKMAKQLRARVNA